MLFKESRSQGRKEAEREGVAERKKNVRETHGLVVSPTSPTRGGEQTCNPGTGS